MSDHSSFLTVDREIAGALSTSTCGGSFIVWYIFSIRATPSLPRSHLLPLSAETNRTFAHRSSTRHDVTRLDPDLTGSVTRRNGTERNGTERNDGEGDVKQ